MNVEIIPVGAHISLDTPAFVYHTEDHPRYYAAADALFSRIHVGGLRAFASTLVLAELLVPYYRAGDSNLARIMGSTLRDFPNLRLVPVHPRIALAPLTDARHAR